MLACGLGQPVPLALHHDPTLRNRVFLWEFGPVQCDFQITPRGRRYDREPLIAPRWQSHKGS